MNIIDVLKVQHKVILGQLDYLEKLKDKKGMGACCLRQVVSSVVNMVDQHARLEETRLFPELEAYLGSQMSSIAVMEFEHREIKKILENIKRTNQLRETTLEAVKLIVFLRDHIDKEERVLFPIADQNITQKRLEELLDG